MRVLALDTSMPRAFVAAVEDGTVVCLTTSDRQTAHAERLLGMVAKALDTSGWGAGGTDLVAVCRGPGSFTGVRVGVATAKGWAFARGIPLVGVESLEAMCWSARQRLGAAGGVALVDARKGEVFAGFYDAGGARLTEPVHVPRAGVEQWVRQAELSTGCRCAFAVGELADVLGLAPDLAVRSTETDMPSATAVAALAVDRWSSTHRDELVDLEPLYVRPPDITLPAAKSTPGVRSA